MQPDSLDRAHAKTLLGYGDISDREFYPAYHVLRNVRATSRIFMVMAAPPRATSLGGWGCFFFSFSLGSLCARQRVASNQNKPTNDSLTLNAETSSFA